MKKLSFLIVKSWIITLMFSYCTGKDLQEEVIKYKRMIILIDQTGCEKVGGKTAGTSALALALHQQACSILTSPSMLIAFLERKYPKIQSHEPNVFKLASFDLSAWRIYYLKSSNFFFLTPKNQYGLIQDTAVTAYGQQFFSYEKISVTEKDLEQGMSFSKEIIIPVIKTQNLEPFLRIPATPQNLYSWVNQKQQPHKIFKKEQLESLFFNENDFQNIPLFLDEFSFINRIHANKIKEKEIDYKNLIDSPKIKFLPHKTAPQFRDLLQSKIDFIRAATTAWNFYVFGHGSYEYPPQGMSYSIPTVADLRAIDDRDINPHYGRPNQLTPFLLFFNKINTHLIALSSCYSGGKNLNYVRFKEGLRKEKIAHKLSYILAVLSSTDTESTTVTGISGSAGSPTIDWDTSTNIERFFEYLDRKPRNEAQANWLTDALSALALPLDHPENIPQVLIPEQDWFQVFTAVKEKDKNSIILNDDEIKKHRDNKTSVNVDSDKKILLFTNIIPIDIAVDASKPLPQFTSKIPGDTFHAFNQIRITNFSGGEANKAISKYIENFFCSEKLKSNETEKKYFIKNFRIAHDVYQNILITVQKNGWSFTTLPPNNNEAEKYSNYLVSPPNLPTRKLKNKAIITLGNLLIKKHEIEKSILDLSDVETVLLSRNIIPIDISIDAATTIPQFISRKPGETFHVFKKIVIQNATKTKNEYLAQLFSSTLKSVEAEKKFFIQELEVINAQKEPFISKNILITKLKNTLGSSELSDQNTYSKYLDDYFANKPQWSKQQTPVLAKSIASTKSNELGLKLEELKGKLEALKSKLKQLAQTLKSLQNKLKA